MPQEVVVITGASAGVGRATAHAFAKRQASIGLLARDSERLERTRAEVVALGGRALAHPTDVADAEQVAAAAAHVERALGPIDIWVNNAMTTIFSPVEKITPAEFKRATEVTYLGTVYGTMAALSSMRPRNHGTIVQVGSALAYRAIPLQAPYCGAKHAIRGFTDSLRTELRHERSQVHLTMVQLPALNTPQFNWCKAKLPRHPQPVPPIFQPEVAAEGIVWASHHKRREISIGAPVVAIILANKIAPGLVDRYLARTGYQSQQMTEPIDPARPNNLFSPVPQDYGAHGVFDSRAQESSLQLWATTHHLGAVGNAVAALTGTVHALLALFRL